MNNTITLSDGKTITLNDQQSEALKLMAEWAKDPTALFFTLAGYAGTGKTTIVKSFIDSLRAVDPQFKVAVTAPTHKAKNVVAKSTGLHGSTLQSLMGIGVDSKIENYDPENPTFVEKRKPDFSKFKMVICDESSMINSALLKSLLTTADKFGTKVLFMGDKAQLPPVGEIVSDVFSCELITYKYQLTEVMRQAGDSPLMPLYTKFRNNLQNPQDLVDKVTNLNDKGEGYRFVKLNEFATELSSKYAKSNFDPHSVKVLCWTNDEVQAWNKYIREKRMAALHPKLNPLPLLYPGDLLVGMANRGFLINSEEYLVKSASIGTVACARGMQGKEVLTHNLRVAKVVCEEVSSKREREFNVLYSDNPVTIKNYRECYFYHYNKANKTKKWASFMEFREEILLITPIPLGTGAPISPDLDFGYALTVHKSQGSTYDEVYIHKDIWRNPIVVERNQLKYVAASRPRKVANFLI